MPCLGCSLDSRGHSLDPSNGNSACALDVRARRSCAAVGEPLCTEYLLWRHGHVHGLVAVVPASCAYMIGRAKSQNHQIGCCNVSSQPKRLFFPSLDQSLGAWEPVGGIGRWSFFGSGAAHGERSQVHHAPRQSAHLLGHGGKALADWPHLSKHRRHWSPGSKWASPAFGRRQSALGGEMRIKVGGR